MIHSAFFRLIVFYLLAFVHYQSIESASGETLTIAWDDSGEKFVIESIESNAEILTHHAGSHFRPYFHPIVAPDKKGVLTEYSPGHHPHQTGLYWGFTRVNGRDYFHNPGKSHWRRKDVVINEASGERVSWKTVYEMLDADGNVVMLETQSWAVWFEDGRCIMDVTWSGYAQTDVVISKYDYGGLFLRMPWKPGVKAETYNGARHKNQEGEGERGLWVDIGMDIEGRDDFGRIAIFDHPSNNGFPLPFRIDGQFGVGPARARLGDWNIKKGQSANMKHRLLVYSGEYDELKIRNAWQEYSRRGTHVLWGLAQQEGRIAEFLTPEKAVEIMDVQDGLEANVFAAEPMMTQPMAFCWDSKGRMWIAENRDYESRGSGFANSGDSRILILEDTDRDGVADKRKVFAEGIPFPAGIAVGFDGLWLGAPPNLLFVPDRDKDDKADMDEIEVRLTGWGIRDRHETLNSFHWGPDGWLYGCQGFATPSKVGKPKGKGKLYDKGDPFPKNIELEGDGTDINGGVWRYHPIEDKFEVVAHGFSNPWGIDYDANGQIFITACVIPHMFHVIPGGIYHRQGGRHYNPYVYQDIRTIVDHRHRSAHGGARVYISDSFPEKYHGQLFMANIHEHAVLTDVLKPKGSGFVASHGEDLLKANNAQWIGFSMEIGPAGDVYVLDWHDADICGKDILNKDTGRVFRISAKDSKSKDWEGRYDDLSTKSDHHLVELQKSASAWHARRARLVLQERAVEGVLEMRTLEDLNSLFISDSPNEHRLRALWAIYTSGGWNNRIYNNARKDQYPYIRGWAIQLQTQSNEDLTLRQIRQLERMAKVEKSPVVRLYLAAALQRLSPDHRWKIAKNLMQHSEDSDDHNIPKMIWFGIEGIVAESPEEGMRLAADSKIPLLQNFISRRIIDAGHLDSFLSALSSVAGQKNSATHQILSGGLDGMSGKGFDGVPETWDKIYSALQGFGSEEITRNSLRMAQLFGDKAAVDSMIAILKDTNSTVSSKSLALEGLVSKRRSEVIPLLSSLINDRDLQLKAIQGIAAFDEKELADSLISSYSKFDASTKLEVLQTLAARPSYGRALLDALKGDKISKSEIPAYVARQLKRVVGLGFVEFWGNVEALSSDKEEKFTKYQNLLTNENLSKANVIRGKQLFEKNCSVCHKLYGKGGELGPDITGANRQNLDYLLDNILDPSGIIQDDYKMVVINTNDGRTLAGNVSVETQRQLTLRIVGQNIDVAKSEIRSREVLDVSMMPEGLLDNLSEEEVADLIGYLQTDRAIASSFAE